jgi:hypothetical protein
MARRYGPGSVKPSKVERSELNRSLLNQPVEEIDMNAVPGMICGNLNAALIQPENGKIKAPTNITSHE